MAQVHLKGKLQRRCYLESFRPNKMKPDVSDQYQCFLLIKWDETFSSSLPSLYVTSSCDNSHRGWRNGASQALLPRQLTPHGDCIRVSSTAFFQPKSGLQRLRKEVRAGRREDPRTLKTFQLLPTISRPQKSFFGCWGFMRAHHKIMRNYEKVYVGTIFEIHVYEASSKYSWKMYIMINCID